MYILFTAASSGSQVVDTRPDKIYCKVKNQCVDIAQPRDGSGLHWPFCAIVPRCSGCCGLMSTLMSCQPTIKTNHSIEVMYIPYDLSSHGASSSNSKFQTSCSVAYVLITVFKLSCQLQEPRNLEILFEIQQLYEKIAK